MNLAQMLMLKPQSLDERYKNKSREPKKVNVRNASIQNVINRNTRNRMDAIARYRAVMPDEWTATVDIEIRLNMKRSTAYKVLNKWMAAGYVERRDCINEKALPFIKHEWKWIKQP